MKFLMHDKTKKKDSELGHASTTTPSSFWNRMKDKPDVRFNERGYVVEYLMLFAAFGFVAWLGYRINREVPIPSPSVLAETAIEDVKRKVVCRSGNKLIMKDDRVVGTNDSFHFRNQPIPGGMISVVVRMNNKTVEFTVYHPEEPVWKEVKVPVCD